MRTFEVGLHIALASIPPIALASRFLGIEVEASIPIASEALLLGFAILTFRILKRRFGVGGFDLRMVRLSATALTSILIMSLLVE